MSKLRIEKLKQGISSNNDVLVYRNDLGTFQGQSNVVLNTITLGGNTVNSSVYTGTSLNANSTTYFGGQLSTYYANATVPGTAYSNAVTYAGTIAATAYSNAVSTASSDATTKAGTAYSNAVTYAGTIAATAYSNAVSTASSDATTKAATAYSNAISYSGNAALAYANAIAYSGNAALAYANAIAYSGNAALAYANAIAYAASNTYVNSTFAPLASPTLTGLLTANNVTITGNLTVSGTTTYVNSTNLNIGDNIITLNADVTNVTAPTENAGIEVNRGSAANVQLRWNETLDIWQSTLDGTTYLTLATNNDVTTAYSNGVSYANSTFLKLTGGALSGAVSGITTLATGNTTVTGFVNVSTFVAAANINTSGTVSADIITVSNVAQTQTNLQVDPQGTAFLNAIIYG